MTTNEYAQNFTLTLAAGAFCAPNVTNMANGTVAYAFSQSSPNTAATTGAPIMVFAWDDAWRNTTLFTSKDAVTLDPTVRGRVALYNNGTASINVLMQVVSTPPEVTSAAAFLKVLSVGALALIAAVSF